MHRFKKTQRLLKKNEYEYVFNQAKKIVNYDFIVLYRENTIGYARIGLALSKKMIAKAHDRNRLKRLLRESFRNKIIPALDIVVLARSGVANTQNSIIFNRLKILWDRL